MKTSAIKIEFAVALLGALMILQPAFGVEMLQGDAPGRDYNTLNSVAVTNFLNAHQNVMPTPAEIDQFSGEVVHNHTVSLASPGTPSTKGLTNSAHLMNGAQIVNVTSNSANKPCPKGYQILQSNTAAGTFLCYQAAQSDLTFPGDPSDHYQLQTYLTVNSNGQGIVYAGSPISNPDGGPESNIDGYGLITMRLVDLAPNHILYVGQYESYFFASPQDADLFVAAKCSGSGSAVVYNGASGTIQANGKPSGGYQVNVVDNVPGGDSDYPLQSPLPTGTTNLCPPPSPSNN